MARKKRLVVNPQLYARDADGQVSTDDTGQYLWATYKVVEATNLLRPCLGALITPEYIEELMEGDADIEVIVRAAKR